MAKTKLTHKEKLLRQKLTQRLYRERKRNEDSDYDKKRAEKEREKYYSSKPDVKKRKSKYRNPCDEAECETEEKILKELIEKQKKKVVVEETKEETKEEKPKKKKYNPKERVNCPHCEKELSRGYINTHIKKIHDE